MFYQSRSVCPGKEAAAERSSGVCCTACDTLHRCDAHAEEICFPRLPFRRSFFLRQGKNKKAFPASSDQFRDQAVLHTRKAGKAVKVETGSARGIRIRKQAKETRQHFLRSHSSFAKPALERPVDSRKILQFRRKKRRDAFPLRNLQQAFRRNIVHIPFRKQTAELCQKAGAAYLPAINGQVFFYLFRSQRQQKSFAIFAQHGRFVRRKFAKNASCQMAEADDFDVQHGPARTLSDEGLLRHECGLLGDKNDMMRARILSAFPDHLFPQFVRFAASAFPQQEINRHSPS